LFFSKFSYFRTIMQLNGTQEIIPQSSNALASALRLVEGMWEERKMEFFS